MDGYIISLKPDAADLVRYWSINRMVDNIDDADFITESIAARRSLAALQSQFLDHTVTLHPAFKGVQLKNVVSAVTGSVPAI